jgi:SAM-dependent methyltransferase
MSILKSFPRATLALLVCLALTSHVRAVEIAAPYVPTAQSVVERMLQIAKVGPDDFVIDLGSGDGRIVITAAQKYGARGFGVDIDPELVAQANANARKAGVSDRVQFHERDLFATDLSSATVVTIYLLTRSVIKLQAKLFDLQPGTRIVSHAGSMGEWKADHFEMLDVRDRVRPDAPGRTYLYVWIVPAKVAGRWRWSLPVAGRSYDYELNINQKFQAFSGTLKVGGRQIPLTPGKLTGDRITLNVTAELNGAAVRHQFDGRISGRTITGTASLDSNGVRSATNWNAARADPPDLSTTPAYPTAR